MSSSTVIAKDSILQLCCIMEKPVENAPLVLIIDPQTKVGRSL